MRSSTSLCRSSTRSCTRDSTAVRSRSGRAAHSRCAARARFAARATSSGVDSGIAAIGPAGERRVRRVRRRARATRRRVSGACGRRPARARRSRAGRSRGRGARCVRGRAPYRESTRGGPSESARDARLVGPGRYTPSVSRTSACTSSITAARPSAADGAASAAAAIFSHCGHGVVPQRVPDGRHGPGGHRQAGDAEPDQHQREQRVAGGLAAHADRLVAPLPAARGRGDQVEDGRLPGVEQFGQLAGAAGRWPSRTG